MELNPLAIRVRLFDPTRWLALFDPWLPKLFHPALLVLWLLAVLPALLLAAAHWQELRAFAVSHLDTPRYLLIAWIAYPIIKAVHELGHALAVRRWGGEVHDIGFTMFVLVPVPYVDASSASGFPYRSQRALVSAIGIMIELLFAALALYVWLSAQPGWVHDIAFSVMLISGVSTLVFNGNPLLRFDGYHLLCDLFDLPNLDTRSRAWWKSLIQRRIFKMDAVLPPLAGGERKWMLGYAPLALAYRCYISLLVVWWVAAKSVLFSLVVALAAVWMLLVMPLAGLAGEIGNFPQAGIRRRARLIVGGAVAVILIGLLLVPMPFGAVAQAVVSLPEQAQVRAETEGFLSELKVRDGDQVAAGQVLAVLDAPDLLARQAEAQSRVVALQVQQFNAMRKDPVRVNDLGQALVHAEAELAQIEAQVAKLEIRSQIAGRMVMVRQDDLPDTLLKKGQPLGYILAPGELIVRAVVPHEDGTLVGERFRSAQVWLTERPGEIFPGRLRRDAPAATFTLPDAALADQNGGNIVTDPADTLHLRALQPFFLFDVAISQSATPHIGGRAWVRFDFGYQPLAFQWAHRLHQLFLQHLDS